MPNPREYDPKYVEIDDIPIEVEDRYPSAEKREALYQAEPRLEFDTNSGEEITEDELNGIHISAILNLGTYLLVRGATSNMDVTLGDLDDGGEQTERHAEQYLETYKELVQLLEDEEGVYFGVIGDGYSVAVNQGTLARQGNLPEDDRGDGLHDDFTA